MLTTGQRNAVVVAHPDDETLWAGALLASREKSSREKPWDVICCTVPRRDPERSLRFYEAVRVLGGFPILIPITETEPNEDLPHLAVVDLSPYDCVVTHNKEGEYGHRHHRNVHEYVMRSDVPAVYSFGYGAGTEEVFVASNRKEQALMCYDHTSPSDGQPKWQALLDRYPINLHREYFNVERR